MKKRFHLDEENFRIYNGVKIFQLIADKEFAIRFKKEGAWRTKAIAKGMKGGWVSKEVVISETDASWVLDDAVVIGAVTLDGDTCITDDAVVSSSFNTECDLYLHKCYICGQTRLHSYGTFHRLRMDDAALLSGIVVQEGTEEIYLNRNAVVAGDYICLHHVWVSEGGRIHNASTQKKSEATTKEILVRDAVVKQQTVEDTLFGGWPYPFP